MTNVGLDVRHGISAGAISFKDPSKRNLGLLMLRERGVPGKVYRITSKDDDARYFGGETVTSYGYWVMKSLFENAEPASPIVYGSRVVGADAVAATANITFGSSAIVGTAAQLGFADPGLWGNKISTKFYTFDQVTLGKYTLQVLYDNIVKETFEAETMALVINAANTTSKLAKFTIDVEPDKDFTAITGTVVAAGVTLTGTSTTFTTQLVPGDRLYQLGILKGIVKSITSNTVLTLTSTPIAAFTGDPVQVRENTYVASSFATGTEGTTTEALFYQQADNTPLGLSVFDGVDVQIIGITDAFTSVMAGRLKTYCEDNRKFGVFQLPFAASETAAEVFSTAQKEVNISYIAAYNEWINVYNSLGQIVTIPGLGAFLGAGFVRTPYLQGDHIHIPPAGTDSVLKNVAGLGSPLLNQAGINKYVQVFNVNVLKYNDTIGYFLISSRALSSNSLYSSIHIILQLNFYLKVLEQLLLFALQKPNTPELRKEIIAKLDNYFEKEYDKGALERSLPFEEVFIVTCDDSNNPTSQDRKLLNVTIDYIPTEATESITISLNRNDAYLTSKVS